MARYFTVEQAASILETTDRTVRRMLADGRLAGSQHLEKGKQVWRVHASKEILERLPVASVSDEEIVEVETESATASGTQTGMNFEPPKQPQTWQEGARAQTGNMAEHFWNEVAGKFLDRLAAQDQLIGSLQTELEEKDRQLKLLPDLQKVAEEKRQAAELKELEAEALRKQILALEEARATELAEAEKKIAQLKNLEAETVRQIAALAEARTAEVAKTEQKAAELALELQRVNETRAHEAKVADERLAELTGRLAMAEQPWWKKLW